MNESSALKKLPLIGKSPLLGLSVTALLLAACGGGGGSGNGGGNPLTNNGSSKWVAGEYKSAEDFYSYCEKPRAGASKVTGVPFPDRKGSLLQEKNFLRSWSHETYLWYSELPDINPANNDDAIEYFDKLVTSAITSTGAPKDKYHYADSTEEVEARYIAGKVYGYGLGLVFYSSIPPRDLRVAYVEAGSPAANAGITRGAKIISVDGVDLVNNNTMDGINALNEGLFPGDIGAVHSFGVRDVGLSSSRTLTLQSGEIVTSPVLLSKMFDTDTGKVGYIVFNSHIQSAESQLYDVINNFKSQPVTDLILDLRYNGGGLIDLAATVGYMIAGQKSKNKTFEQLVFNNKIQPESPVLFDSTGNYGVTRLLEMPSLELNRVYILSGANTCSASESIINGLRGINVEVVLIGEQTCGKPYGFMPVDNCGTTYSTIQFRGENAKKYGDYSDGFIPSVTDNQKERVKGCLMDDDFTFALGDINDKLVKAAMHYRKNNVCPTIAKTAVRQKAVSEKLSASGLSIQEDLMSRKVLMKK